MVLRSTKTSFAVGEESTWGTPVAPTEFHPTVDGGIDIHLVTDRGRVATGTEGFMLSSGIVPGARHWEASVQIQLAYEKLGKIMKFLFGKTETVTGSAAVGFSHTWTPDPSIPAVEGKGLTVELALNPATFLRYDGGKITEGHWHIEQGGGMTLDLTLIGRECVATVGTPTTIVFPSGPKVVAHHQGAGQLFALTPSGGSAVNLRVRSFDVTLRNGIAHYDPTIQDTVLGEPIRSSPIEVDWEAECEADDTTLLGTLKANTLTDVNWALEGPAIPGAGVNRYINQLRMVTSMLNSGGDPNQDTLGEPAIHHLSGWGSKSDDGSTFDLLAMMKNSITTEV